LTRGRVAWYSTNLGHGFIIPEDGGPKAFVRRGDIAAGEEKALDNNDIVSYEVIHARRDRRRRTYLEYTDRG
jgi:CspA family cold shock protein